MSVAKQIIKPREGQKANSSINVATAHLEKAVTGLLLHKTFDIYPDVNIDYVDNLLDPSDFQKR